MSVYSMSSRVMAKMHCSKVTVTFDHLLNQFILQLMRAFYQENGTTVKWLTVILLTVIFRCLETLTTQWNCGLVLQCVTCVGSPHQRITHWWNMAPLWWEHSWQCASGRRYPPPPQVPPHLHTRQKQVSQTQKESSHNTQALEDTLTFRSLYADLQWGHSGFGGVHCECLRNVGSDVGAQTWTLALHLGAVHCVTDRHREWTACVDRASGRLGNAVQWAGIGSAESLMIRKSVHRHSLIIAVSTASKIWTEVFSQHSCSLRMMTTRSVLNWIYNLNKTHRKY